MPRKIIIDTDPGQDDAVAMLLAFASPDELEVIGVTTVAGNVSLKSTTANAQQVLELAGRTDVPLYAGCARPMSRPLVTAEHVHGPTGLDGPVLPAPSMPVQGQHAVPCLIEMLRAAEPGTITLVTLGPLTNIGMALVQAPHRAANQEMMLILGTWSENGNIPPAAAFNEYVDPRPPTSCCRAASRSRSCRWTSRISACRRPRAWRRCGPWGHARPSRLPICSAVLKPST